MILTRNTHFVLPLEAGVDIGSSNLAEFACSRGNKTPHWALSSERYNVQLQRFQCCIFFNMSNLTMVFCLAQKGLFKYIYSLSNLVLPTTFLVTPTELKGPVISFIWSPPYVPSSTVKCTSRSLCTLSPLLHLYVSATSKKPPTYTFVTSSSC